MDKVKLGDIIESYDNLRKPISGYKRLEMKNGELYPYYGANGIVDYVNDYIFDDEYLCIAEDGGQWGKNENCSYIINKKCWVNNHAHVVKVKELINIKYLNYYLNYMDLNSYISGAVVRKLTKENLNKIDVPNYNLQTQQKIVEELDCLSDIIEKKKQQLVDLDNLIKSQFVEMFGNTNDSKYPVKTIEEISVFVKDGTHQTPIYTDDKCNGFKFLSSKDVTSGYINWQNIKYIPKDLHNELYAKIKPQRNDILLAKNGTTGVAAIVETDDIFDIYVSLALLRFKSNNIKYLWCAINMPDTKKQFNKSLKGVGVPNLHLSEIKKAKLIIPPIELQNQFAELVENIEKSKNDIKQSIEETQNLMGERMQHYFGE